jgi:Tfp pilus assembly protein PilO
MNIQLSTLNRILIVGGLFVVIALIVFFFTVQPKKNQEAVTRAQIADLQAQYDELKRVADQKPLYLAFTDQIRQRLKGVEVTADPRLYVPSFLKQVEDLASKDGLYITTVTPTATAAPSPGPSGSPSAGQVAPPNIPVVGGVANQVARGVGAQNATSTQTGQVLQATGPVGATPVPGAPSAGVPAGGEANNPARAAALAYLAQSFTQVPFNMEFDGHYDGIERFLRDLAKFQKLIGVGDVTIAPGSGTPAVGTSPRLKITLPIVAYRLSPNAPATGPLVLPTPTPKPGVKK